MKRCPTCSRVYDDVSLRFCLDDGTELIDKPESNAPATLVLPETERHAQSTMQVPPMQTPTAAVTKRRGVLIWILGAIVLLIVLGGGLAILAKFVLPKKPLVQHLTLRVDPATPDRDAAVTRSVAVITSRLNGLGVSNFKVRPGDPGSGLILIDLPKLNDPERVKQVISGWGKLELVHVISPASPAPVQTFATQQEAVASLGGAVPSNRRVLPYPERDELPSASPSQSPVTKRWVVIESPAIVDGSSIRDASAVRAPMDNYDILFTLNQAGASRFGAWTSANINEYLGVMLNDEVKSIAFIKSQITDQGQITGRFAKQSAEDLALVLRAGALPARLEFVDEKIDKQ
jgi:protein-export membrane protein SecD